MNVYTPDHIFSRVVCAAFAAGHEGKIVPPRKLLDGPAAVYGILRGCGEIIKECEWVGRSYYHIDHGYFGRGHYDGYYRITKNAFQWIGGISGYSSDRWEALKVEMKRWRKSGRHVVVCPISGYLGDFLGIDAEQWTAAVVREISLHTERPIVVKDKHRGTLKEALVDAWCLVTHSSNAAVDALVDGIPVVALGRSATAPVAWHLTDMEKPHWPEREPWAHALAHHQFTLSEMRGGLRCLSMKDCGCPVKQRSRNSESPPRPLNGIAIQSVLNLSGLM